MNASPIRDARLRIELDTQDAQARLDELEEKMEEIQGDIDNGQQELQENDKKTREQKRGGQHMNKRDQTKPGRFGISQIPGLLSAEGIAGAVPGIGNTLRTMVNAELRYGAFADGFVKGIAGDLFKPPPPEERKWYQWILDSQKKKAEGPLPWTKPGDEASPDSLHKRMVDLDQRLKAFSTTFEKIVQFGSAQALTGGHVDPAALTKFARNTYEWEFVQARKDKDIRDKTLRVLAQEAPGVVKDLFNAAVSGKLVP